MSIPPNSLYDFGPQAPGVLSAPRLAAAPGPAPTGPVNPAVAGIHVPLWLLGAIGAWFLFMQPGRRRNPEKFTRRQLRELRHEARERARGGSLKSYAPRDYYVLRRRRRRTLRGNPGGARVVYNRLLGGWYVVRGPSQAPLAGRFASKAEALAWLRRDQPGRRIRYERRAS